jgi:hypothetical protein
MLDGIVRIIAFNYGASSCDAGVVLNHSRSEQPRVTHQNRPREKGGGLTDSGTARQWTLRVPNIAEERQPS